MNIGDVMDELGAALDTIQGLRVFPYWADRVHPPAAIVGWPDPYTFDSTYQRGADLAVFPVTILVAKVDARSARDDLSRFADGSGTASVKAVLEAATYTTVDSVRVQSVSEFAVVTVGGTDYLAATFQVETIGSGS